MNANNWPLVAFTLTMQFAAGIVLMYDLFLVFPMALKKAKLPRRFRLILLIAMISAIAGIAFSILHLGNPANAIKTVSNINESWLSREIFMALIFTGLLVLSAFLQFGFPSSLRSYKWLIDLTSLSGLILVYTMSRIYMLPSMPAWDSIFTPIGFFMAMLLSGASFMLLLQLNHGSWASQKGLALIIIAVAVIQTGLLPVHMSWLGQAGDAAKSSLSLLLTQYLPAFYLRLGFYILTIAFGFWAFFSIRSDTIRQSKLFIPALLAFITMVGGLVIDRFLFYQQIVSVGNL